MLNNVLPALILYAKVPLPGMVKTRLKISGNLSNKFVVNIQKAMIQDILHCISLVEAEFVPILSYHPFKYLHIMEELVNIVPTINIKLIFQAQVGSNQAFRFSSAIASAFSIPIINGVVIIGADTPQIQPNFLKKIINNVQSNKKLAYLGPSQLGGFYILGISKPVLNLENVFLRGKNEYQNLVNLLSEQNFTINYLPEMRDIDTIYDFKIVAKQINELKTENYENRNKNYIPEKTIKIIENLEI